MPRCKVDTDCPVRKSCDVETGRCAARGSRGGKRAVASAFKREAPKVQHKPRGMGWDKSWKLGMKGFNAYAAAKMRAAGLRFESRDLKCPTLPPLPCEAGEKKACRAPSGKFSPAPYQKTVAYLVHPETTVDRMLVAHRTGLGMTYTMILVLDNFFDDPRAKAIIFPNHTVRGGFYSELMKFPSRWRDFVVRQTGIECIDSDKDYARVVDTLALTGMLSKAGTPGFPRAPLRALLYTEAGRKSVYRGQNPLFNFGKKHHKGDPYDNMVVLMDEFHNLLHPEEAIRKRPPSMQSLARMKNSLERASSAVIVGLTATPVFTSQRDVRDILDVLRGHKYANAPTDEGFVSYFQELPENIFASVRPGPPPGTFPHVFKVDLKGDNLKEYVKAQRTHSKTLSGEKLMRKIHNYSSMSATYRAHTTPGAPLIKRMQEDPEGAATKLYHVVKDIMHVRRKTLVMVHRESGYKALQAMWKMMADEKEYPCPKSCWIGFYNEKRTSADIRNLKLFNCEGNKDGDLIRVAFVDSKFYEAGVSFFGVRRLIMVDVPTSWSSWMQRMGRVLRFCGHANLPAIERKVYIQMYVATRPSGDETSDEYFIKLLKRQNEELMGALHYLRDNAVDRSLMKVFDNESSVKRVLNAIKPQSA